MTQPLASIGRAFHADTKLTVGAKGVQQPPLAPLPATAGDEIAIAVVGAHLSGMALNGELQALGGRLLEETVTAPDYRLYALDTTPPKPGMLRDRSRRRHARSSSSCGRCRRLPSANSSPRSRRRCRSAPSASPTAAA